MLKIKLWAVRHYTFWLTLIVIWSLVTRVVRLDQPKEYVFDEVYHAVTAKLIARNDAQAYEWWNPPVEPNTAVDWLHPPLAKYTQAFFIKTMGENPLAWRLSAALAGVLVIVLTAKLAYALFDNHLISLLAAALASLDGLLLTQSRIAMNDIHVTAAILAALWCYAQFAKHQPAQKLLPIQAGRKWWWWSVVMAGIAMGSKWSGLFVVVWLVAAEGWRTLQWLLKTEKPKRTTVLKWLSWSLVGLGVVPICIYVLSYTHMFLQGKTLMCLDDHVIQGKCYCDQTSSGWVTMLSKLMPSQKATWEGLEARGGCKRLVSHFSELHIQIWWYQTTLKATHAYQSRPWQWFLDLKPVWFYVKYYDDGRVSNIYAFGNPAVFWGGDLAVLATGVWLLTQYRKTKVSAAVGPVLSLLTAYLIVWLPWQLSPRIMFFYHYTPAVPLLCIITAWWLHRLTHYRIGKWPIGRYIVGTFMATCLLAFVVWYPHWTNLPVSTKWLNQIYFSVPGWK